MDTKNEIRPWGQYSILLDEKNCKVKKIVVKPHSLLSLQSHNKRSEVWTVVDGIGNVKIENQEIELCVGMSVCIEVGKKHRMENKHDFPMTFIEVQTGTYFGEDDIIRYDDIYGRI